MSFTSTYVAGALTADDWRTFRNELKPDGTPGAWRLAYTNYFEQRLRLRYLEPIRLLQEHGRGEGEGFSIVAIQCTLIEFLASTLKGQNYRYVRRGDPPIGPHEYSDSAGLFKWFLSKCSPFREYFSEEVASEFYTNVRCALLHEARTKNGWRIWTWQSGPDGHFRRPPVDFKYRIVFRDNLQFQLLEFVRGYGRSLETDASLQEAFMRKFDSLAA